MEWQSILCLAGHVQLDMCSCPLSNIIRQRLYKYYFAGKAVSTFLDCCGCLLSYELLQTVRHSLLLPAGWSLCFQTGKLWEREGQRQKERDFRAPVFSFSSSQGSQTVVWGAERNFGGRSTQYWPPGGFTHKVNLSLSLLSSLVLSSSSEKSGEWRKRKWLKKQLIHTPALTAGWTEGKSNPHFYCFPESSTPQPQLNIQFLHPDKKPLLIVVCICVYPVCMCVCFQYNFLVWSQLLYRVFTYHFCYGCFVELPLIRWELSVLLQVSRTNKSWLWYEAQKLFSFML